MAQAKSTTVLKWIFIALVVVTAAFGAMSAMSGGKSSSSNSSFSTPSESMF